MTATINILQNKFGGLKKLPTFVMPRNDNDYRSNRYISNRLFNKAGFLSDNSTSVVLRFLAEIRWRLASFCTYIPQFVGQKMPRNVNNLKADAQGASASTVRNRNSAPVIRQSRTTQSPKSDVQRSTTPYSTLKATEPKKRTWRISLNCTGTPSTITNLRSVGIYHTDLYEATSQDEAVGIAVQFVSRRFPLFEVDLRSVKCTTLNPATL